MRQQRPWHIARVGALCAVVAALVGCTPHHVFSDRFDQVAIVHPAGGPEALTILLSSAEGISSRDHALAALLAGQGSLVGIVDTSAFLASLAADGDPCSYPDGDLENLGHAIEAAYELPGYRPPILAGNGIGATVAMAAIAQANDDTFAGAVTTGFVPRLTTADRFCNTGALHTRDDHSGMTVSPPAGLTIPWIDQQADPPATSRLAPFMAAAGGQVTLLSPGRAGDIAHDDRALATAFDRLKARQQAKATAALPAGVADLPLTILPAAPTHAHDDTMAIFLSGDGGWAGIDKDIGGALARAGIPVVGFDSLRYYWRRHDPETSAHDIARVMNHYRAAWHRPRVLLIGYSRGADVLPFVFNRLPPDDRKAVQRLVLLSLGSHITFKFHVISWFGFAKDGQPVTPEAAALPPGLAMCVYGTTDDDSICQHLDPADIQQIPLDGGHHFDGGYQEIAKLILANLAPRTGVTPPTAAAAR